MPWEIDPAVFIPVLLGVVGCNLVCLIVLMAFRPAASKAEEGAALAKQVRGALAEGLGTFVLVSACLLPTLEPLHGLLAGAAVLGLLAGALGGHFNPAVTLGLVFAGRFGVLAGFGYVSAQLCGAIGAAVAFASWKGLDALAAFPPSQFPIEAIGAGLLVLAAAGCSSGEAKKHGPLSLALALAAAGLFALPHGGGTFNPARHAASALITSQPGPWLACLIGPMAGGVVTGLAMRLVLEPAKPKAAPKLAEETRRLAA